MGAQQEGPASMLAGQSLCVACSTTVHGLGGGGSLDLRELVKF